MAWLITQEILNKRSIRIFRDLNELLDNKHISIKLLIPTDVLDPFKELYQRYSGNIPNPNENTQRAETTSMDEKV